jgi:hypothetical protein
MGYVALRDEFLVQGILQTTDQAIMKSSLLRPILLQGVVQNGIDLFKLIDARHNRYHFTALFPLV